MGSNLSRISGLSPVGSRGHREAEGSVAGEASGQTCLLDVASRGSLGKVAGRGQRQALPFKLNQEFDDASVPKINKDAYTKRAKVTRISKKEARARSAGAGNRGARREVARSKVTSGALGYSYRRVQHERGPSNKSQSSFNSQVSPEISRKP